MKLQSGESVDISKVDEYNKNLDTYRLLKVSSVFLILVIHVIVYYNLRFIVNFEPEVLIGLGAASGFVFIGTALARTIRERSVVFFNLLSMLALNLVIAFVQWS